MGSAIVGVPARDTLPVGVTSAPACPRCTISLRVITEFRNPGDRIPVDPGPDQSVARDSRGWTYLVTRGTPDQVIVFDPSGRASRTVGQRGAGPGEFRLVEHVAVGPGDSLVAWDRGTRRMSVFRPAPVLTLARTFPFPHPIEGGGFLVDGGGRILANADAGHAQDFGRFIHGYSAAGVKEASWGREEVVIRADLQSRVRHLASGQGGFWAMRSNSYRIERWADSGALQLELQRRDPAFPSYRRNDVTPQTPSKPVYLDLQEVEPDVLAVLVLVPDRRWKAATRFEKSAHGSSFSWTDLDLAFDTVVEFIDTRRGVLLHSQRFDEVATQFVGPSLIALIDDRPDSAAVLRLARVSLHRQ